MSPSGNHRYTIITLLQQCGPLSRTELARRADVSPSTITVAVNALKSEGLIVETATRHARGAGRPQVLVSLAPGAGAAIGLEFGFRHVRGVIVDLSYDILATRQTELGSDYSVEHGIAAALEIVADLERESGYADADLVGIGLGLPSPMTIDGTPSRSSMIPSWRGANVRQLLEGRIAAPLIIENETRLSARAERVWGAARGVDDFVYMNLHFGVGGAIFANGRLLTGKNGGAGEIGHISLDPAGPACRCGNRGCFETYAAIPAILARLSSDHPGIDLQTLFALYAAKDPPTVAAMSETANRVAQMVAMLCNTVNPELVLIGGLLSAAGEAFASEIRAGISPLVLELNRNPRIELGSLGRNVAALGGAARVFELYAGNQLAKTSRA